MAKQTRLCRTWGNIATAPTWRIDTRTLALSDAAGVASISPSIGSIAAAQGTALNQPTYVANAGDGLPAISFDGVDDQMYAANLFRDRQLGQCDRDLRRR
jgi:hypothetical protein